MITISTKELRNNFQAMLDKIQQNERFILIHKSKPVAEIGPVTSVQTFEEASDREIQIASAIDGLRESISPEELDYYLKLK